MGTRQDWTLPLRALEPDFIFVIYHLSDQSIIYQINLSLSDQGHDFRKKGRMEFATDRSPVVS